MSIKRICYNCVPPERHVGCHSTCERYLQERENALDRYDRNLKDREVSIFSVEGIRRNRASGAGMNRKQYKGAGRT